MTLELKIAVIALFAAATNYVGSCATTSHKVTHSHHSTHHSSHTQQQKQDSTPVDVYVFNELKLPTPTPAPKKKEVF